MSWLRPLTCAKQIGVTKEYIRGEIKDGRLPARVHHAPSGRVRCYRIESEDWARYLEQYWPKLKAS